MFPLREQTTRRIGGGNEGEFGGGAEDGNIGGCFNGFVRRMKGGEGGEAARPGGRADAVFLFAQTLPSTGGAVQCSAARFLLRWWPPPRRGHRGGGGHDIHAMDTRYTNGYLAHETIVTEKDFKDLPSLKLSNCSLINTTTPTPLGRVGLFNCEVRLWAQGAEGGCGLACHTLEHFNGFFIV